MLRIKIICVGKLKERYLQDAVSDYAKRLGRYCRLEIAEVSDEPAPEHASAAQKDRIKKKEGGRILSKIDSGDYVIALALDGRMPDSLQAADFLAKRSVSGDSRLCFLIGGSLGLSDEALQRADVRWSLSRLTFPHGIARLLLLEQLYRCFRILANEPYHK